MVKASPAASSLPKLSRTASAVRMPRITNTQNSISTAESPIRPSSSPIAEMMKSVLANGTCDGRPLPSPVPARPPVASPDSDCEI